MAKQDSTSPCAPCATAPITPALSEYMPHPFSDFLDAPTPLSQLAIADYLSALLPAVHSLAECAHAASRGTIITLEEMRATLEHLAALTASVACVWQAVRQVGVVYPQAE